MKNKLRKTIEKLLEDSFFLIKIIEENNSRSLKIVIDSEKPVSVGDTTRIAHTIQDSGELDEFYPGGYRLEVSSPGVGSDLILPFQFRKNVGKKLLVIIKDEDQEAKYEGNLTDVQDYGIRIVCDNKTDQFIPFDNIVKANVEISF